MGRRWTWWHCCMECEALRAERCRIVEVLEHGEPMVSGERPCEAWGSALRLMRRGLDGGDGLRGTAGQEDDAVSLLRVLTGMVAGGMPGGANVGRLWRRLGDFLRFGMSLGLGC